MVELVQLCACGAVTVTIDDLNFSMGREIYAEQYGELPADDSELRLQNQVCCDHCVNHYGIDLSACGSGEPPGECDGGFDVCGTPSQSIEQGDNHHGLAHMQF